MTSVVPHGFHQWRDRVLTFASKARVADTERSENLLLMCDELNAGEKRYGEMYAQVLDETGFSNSQSLDNLLSTARAIPIEKRRLDRLSLAHHHAVAPLRKDPDQMDAVMDMAETAEWGASETRKRVTAAKNKVPNALHPDVPLDEIVQLSAPQDEANPILKAWDNATIEQRNEARAYLFPHSHVEPEASPLTAPCEAPAFGAPADHAPRPDPVGGGSHSEELDIPAFLDRRKKEAASV